MKLHYGTGNSMVDALLDSFGVYNVEDPDNDLVVDYIFAAVAAYEGPVPILSKESYHKEALHRWKAEET